MDAAGTWRVTLERLTLPKTFWLVLGTIFAWQYTFLRLERDPKAKKSMKLMLSGNEMDSNLVHPSKAE